MHDLGWLLKVKFNWIVLQWVATDAQTYSTIVDRDLVIRYKTEISLNEGNQFS